MKAYAYRTSAVVCCVFGLIVATSAFVETARGTQSHHTGDANYVLDWNEILVDTLIATNTPNSSSQRLGAIVHTAVFDAYNGIERRYAPIFVTNTAPPGASRPAAVIAAAHTALVSLFPSRASELDASYEASIASLSDDGEPRGRLRLGVSWGEEVAAAVLAWRATDGFNPSMPYPPFTGGQAVGQWRPTGGNCVAMTGLGLAFAAPFVVASTDQFDPGPPRGFAPPTYADDFNAVKALGRKTASTRTEDQTALAPFWEGNASVHWNQAANQMARAHQLSLSDTNRLLAVLNIAMADTAFTIWNAKRHYGDIANEVTWRPVTAIRFQGDDLNTATVPDPDWLPLVNTPCHPEYPAGHPAQNGAAATVLLSQFDDSQTFTLTTADQPDRMYTSIEQAREDGDNARVWGGMHYPSTVEISDKVGEEIALYIDHNAMKPVRARIGFSRRPE